MSKIYIFLNLLMLICCLNITVPAQKKDRVEAIQKISTEVLANECGELKAGRAINFPKPDYPAEARTARIGGTILVTVKIDKKGAVTEIEKITGHQLLQNAAAAAARKSKFSQTVCDGEPRPISAVLTYNFILFVSTKSYFTPTKIEDLIDIKIDSPYYEPVLSLTESYKLSFGYADKKFYADAPLTRGDFAHFLRLTLDLLSDRAATANKAPREINLFQPYNPQKLTAVSGIKDFKEKEAFSDSVKILLLKYDIAPVNERREFQGMRALTNNEVIDIWSKIFGEESVPVNFEKMPAGDPIISRGEFALFLQESLQVLTYKVLP